MKKRILSILLIMMIITGCIPAIVFAAPTHILALGDSITTGYGLENAETESFIGLLGKDYTVTNKAINGNTIMGIAAQIKNGTITEQEIASADIITITAGGNEMMNLLYAKTAQLHNDNYNTNINAAAVIAAMNNLNRTNLLQNYSLLNTAKQLLGKNNPNYLPNSEEFTSTLIQYHQTLFEVTTLLRKVNPNVQIIVATQYNPYIEFADNQMLHFFYEGIEEAVSQLNGIITTGASLGGYRVADVKTAFQSEHSDQKDLYNANAAISAINLDFHPNANGHAVLANVFHSSIEKSIASSPSSIVFSADANYTRAQMITLLWRAAGSPTPRNTEAIFSDVPANSHYHSAVLWAAENSITAGTSATTFSPDANCSQSQINTFIWRFLHRK